MPPNSASSTTRKSAKAAWRATLLPFRGRLAREPIDLAGHDEVVLGEAADRVRRERHVHQVPAVYEEVRVVPLLLRQVGDEVHEAHRSLEVAEPEVAAD